MTTSNNQSTKNEHVLSPMQADAIRDYLAKCGVENIGAIDVFSSISSTNDYLAQEKVADKTAIEICIAEEQTQGRGRFGHQWWSPPGVNLYLSMLWPLKQWSRQYEMLSLWLLIAIAELLGRLGFIGVQLKWPNDICIGNKKLGGILIERKSFQAEQKLIIGVGLNVAMSKMENMHLEAPWVDLISNKPDWEMSRNEFAAQLVSSLADALVKIEKNTSVDLSSMWSPYDLMYQRQFEFTYQHKRNVGIAQGIDGQGKIIVEVDGELLRLHSAHVSDIKL